MDFSRKIIKLQLSIKQGNKYYLPGCDYLLAYLVLSFLKLLNIRGVPSLRYGKSLTAMTVRLYTAPRPFKGQSEPVDFSMVNDAINFSGGIRPVPGFPPPGVHAAGYSRESTPDSGGSHYMDAYRDPTGTYFYKFFRSFFSSNFKFLFEQILFVNN